MSESHEMREYRHHPLQRSKAMGPDTNFDNDVLHNIPLYRAFVTKMHVIHENHKNRDPDTYLSCLPEKSTVSPNGFGTADQDATDWTRIELPNHPTWTKRGDVVEDRARGWGDESDREYKVTNAGFCYFKKNEHLEALISKYIKNVREFPHDTVIHAGWNYVRVNHHEDSMRECIVVQKPPLFLSAESIVDVEEEVRQARERLSARAPWIEKCKKTKPMNEWQMLPSQIQRILPPQFNLTDDIVFDYCISNPPSNERCETIDGYDEAYAWLDDRLENLAVKLDIDAKNQETFGI